MLTGTIESTIERRLLVNYRIEPEVVARHLPEPFRPLAVGGWAVGGVCFIRLGRIRPAGVPSAWSLTTENAAHRFAVIWEDGHGRREGVYVPRRDTNSRITSWAGGKVFPGDYRLARFGVVDRPGDLRIGVASRDGAVRLSVAARPADVLGGALFDSVDDALAFFRQGSISYSPTRGADRLEGVRLLSDRWEAEPVSVHHMRSSLFDDVSLFPPGSCTLDSGLVMRDLPARWHTEDVVHRSVVGVG
jgi:hypothetical protein